MNTNIISSVLAATQAPPLEVRDFAGNLLCRIDRAGAAELIERKWADPVGRRCVKYLKLRPNAPWNPRAKSWWFGGITTQAVRADETCKRYEPGQLMGDPKLLREHRKLLTNQCLSSGGKLKTQKRSI
jgi:hypothetical protein